MIARAIRTASRPSGRGARAILFVLTCVLLNACGFRHYHKARKARQCCRHHHHHCDVKRDAIEHQREVNR